MPQFSPMSWLFISFFLVVVVVMFCVGVWWGGLGAYKFGGFGKGGVFVANKVWSWGG
uniref:ATP synthase F0 subunit 8 n=1 Tax=Monodontina vondembuschiana TaxID=2508272 RepID=A0A513X0G2_9BIVA|nr:ATP synthase F0 subunit 8 [Monodontina vondembuschiana]